MQHLRPLVERLSSCRVLVIGDVMLDEYVHGQVARISPEAPVPVLEVSNRSSQDLRLGGAANAAANIHALGGHASLCGVVGDDSAASTVKERLQQLSIARLLVTDAARPTSRKTRFVAQQQQILRIDTEVRSPITGTVASNLGREIEGSLADVHAVVLSDYAKGVITPEVAAHAIAAAHRAGLPVIVDPKQRDFSVYRGATVITPNLHELEAASSRISPTEPFVLEPAVDRVMATIPGTALLVTRSAEGMTLYRERTAPFHVRAMAKDVFDVTGAGDTVVATLALALGAKIPFEQAVELSSVAAAISVSKRGTATVTPAELTHAIESP